MKYITLIALASTFLLFTGCENSDFNKSINRDVLEKTDKWYEIDSSRDLYMTFKFSKNRLTKKIYSDSNFNDLIDTKSFNVYYSDDDKFNVTEDGVNYSCEATTCNKDEFVIISCKANESDLKDILYCGWNSQDKAKANMQ